MANNKWFPWYTKRLLQRGFTLPEALVYSIIFASMFTLMVTTLISLSDFFVSSRVNMELMRSGQSVMERLTRDIRKSKLVDVGASTLGVHPGVLALTYEDATENDHDLVFDLSNDVIRIIEDSNLLGGLNGGTITATNLVFYLIDTPIRDAVKMEFTLSNTRGDITRTANFYNTVVLR